LPDLEIESFDATSVADAFGTILGQDTPADTVTPPADEEPATDEHEDTTADEVGEDEGDDAAEAAAQPQAHNPEGPGNVKAALRQVRDENKGLKAQLAELTSWKAGLEAQQQQALYQQQQAQQNAAIAAVIEEMDPADVPAYLERVQQQQHQALQQQFTQDARMSLARQSETLVKTTYQDYDAQVEKLSAAFGPAGKQIIGAWGLQQENPALAVYQVAKSFYTQADIEAAKEEGRREGAETFAANQPARKQQSAPRLANLPPAGPTKDAPTKLQRAEKRLNGGGNTAAAIQDMFAAALG